MDDYHSFEKSAKEKKLVVRLHYWRYQTLHVVRPENGEILYSVPGALKRYYRRNSHFMPHPQGGRCELVVESKSGEIIAKGVSVCILGDNFSYAEARHYALQNLVVY